MFALPTLTAGTVRTFNLRTEKHGDDDVTAMDLGVRVTGPSSLLDMLHTSLREMFYLPPLANQASIPGESPPWTVLRCDAVRSTGVKHELVGRNVVLEPSSEIESELGHAGAIALGACNVNKFSVTAHPGGSVDIDFRIQTNDIDADSIGHAGAMLSQEVKLSVTHTEVEGSHDEPPAAAKAGKKKDATGLFVEGAASTGKVELSETAAWPFPGSDNAKAQAALNDRLLGAAPPQHLVEEKPPHVKAARKKAGVSSNKGAAKYRDAATGETWSGRGLMPRWLKVGMERTGKTLSDFENAAH